MHSLIDTSPKTYTNFDDVYLVRPIVDDKIDRSLAPLSNMYQLEQPIVFDDLTYWNSEGLYYALRAKQSHRQQISELSKLSGYAVKKFCKTIKLEQDIDKRIDFMLIALFKKFESDHTLRSILKSTSPYEIVEASSWNDSLWAIDIKTMSGSNLLGKCLVFIRNHFIQKSNIC